MEDNEGIVPLIRLAESYADVADVKIEEAHAPPLDREQWLQERRKGIGGSDAGAVIGVDPYRSRLDVYHEKIGTAEPRDNPHMKRGRKLEALVAEEYTERHPEETLAGLSGILVHPIHSWMIANPDREIISPHRDGIGILEIKTPARPMFERVKLRGMPKHWMMQMQHYLIVTGYKWGTFAIFNADAWEMMLVDVEAWKPASQESLIAIERDFWENNVVPQVPPLAEEEPRLELPEPEGIIRTVTSREFAAAVAAYESASEYAKEAEELKESAKQAVIEAINAEGGVYENETHRVYYTKVNGRVTFDKKALARAKAIDPVKLLGFLSQRGDGGKLIEELAMHQSDVALDLQDFEKKGNDYMTMRIYPIQPEGE